jgi:fucose permease
MLILAEILAILVYGMTAAMLGTILPDLAAKFHLTPRQNGTIALSQAIGLIIASFGVGPLIDAEGKKLGMVLGLAVLTLALPLLPKSTGFRSIVICMLLLGLGGGSVATGANALASDIKFSNPATTLNLLNLFFGLGGLATPFIAANLLDRNPVRLCYTVAALTAITLAFNIATPMPGPTGAGAFVFAGSVLAKPSLFLIALFIFLYVACEVGTWNWLVQHLIAQGIPESRALNILSLGFALGLLIGRVVFSQVLRTVSPESVTLTSSILMVVTTFWMLHTKTPATAGVAVFLAGVAMAPVFPTMLATVAARFPSMMATAQGIVISSGWIGLAVSSRIIGSIAGGDPKRLKKALRIIPAASVAMVIVNLALRRV